MLIPTLITSYVKLDAIKVAEKLTNEGASKLKEDFQAMWTDITDAQLRNDCLHLDLINLPTLHGVSNH